MPKGEHRRHPAALVQQAEQLIRQGQTQQAVADALGIHRSCVGDWCKQHHWPTNRTGPPSGTQHPGWKGGRVRVGRYWYVYAPTHPHATKTKRVAEHRLVAEHTLQRYLRPEEVVHHLDGDPQNNAPENLQVFRNNGEHLAVDLAGKVPNWSDEGLAILDAVRQRNAILRRSSAGGFQPLQSADPH